MSFDWSAVSGVAVASVILGGAILGRARWVVDHEINDRIKAVNAEFRPNGGQSFRDHFDARLDAVAKHFNDRVSETHHLLEQQAKINKDVEHQLAIIDRRLDDFDRRRRSEQEQHRRRWIGG